MLDVGWGAPMIAFILISNFLLLPSEVGVTWKLDFVIILSVEENPPPAPLQRGKCSETLFLLFILFLSQTTNCKQQTTNFKLQTFSPSHLKSSPSSPDICTHQYYPQMLRSRLPSYSECSLHGVVRQVPLTMLL